jgi:hypothetical protein
LVILSVLTVVPVAAAIAADGKAEGIDSRLVGTWTRTVTAADVKRVGNTSIGPGGLWTLTVKPSGAAHVAV